MGHFPFSRNSITYSLPLLIVPFGKLTVRELEHWNITIFKFSKSSKSRSILHGYFNPFSLLVLMGISTFTSKEFVIFCRVSGWLAMNQVNQRTFYGPWLPVRKNWGGAWWMMPRSHPAPGRRCRTPWTQGIYNENSRFSHEKHRG